MTQDHRPEAAPAATRWLDRSVPAGIRQVSRAVIRQQGELESNERWLTFKANAAYAADPLAFEWSARMRVMPGIWVDAVDGHGAGEAWGGAKLWGIKSVGGRSGPEVHAIQLIRNIAELAWLPQLAATVAGLTWVDAGPDNFEIHARAADRDVAVVFDVSEAGDIVRASSPARPYDVPDGFETAPWRLDYSEYGELAGVRVPTHAVATYELPDGPWEYLRVSVVGIETGN